MQDKKVQVIMKTDTAENWAKCECKYIPFPNTIIVYIYEDGTKKMKFSDGETLLKDLPFIQSEAPQLKVTDGTLGF